MSKDHLTGPQSKQEHRDAPTDDARQPEKRKPLWVKPTVQRLGPVRVVTGVSF
jgi:hypothetical protein